MASRVFWKLFVPLAVLNFIAVLGVVFVHRNIGTLSAIAGFTLLFLFGLLCTTWWIVSWIVEPLGTLSESARRMKDGDYDVPVYFGRRDEFGDLASSFNLLREEMIAKTAEMKRLSTVLAAMTDGVLAIDEEFCVQYANQSAGRMLGFSPAAARGRPLLESVRSHKLHELVTRLFASKTHDEMELEWGDDESNTLLISATFFSEEPLEGIIMMISNLSEVRDLQTMRRDFVANVSHELKTPLSSIKAYAETLREGAINDEKNRDRFVRIIEEQADRLNQLISDLLSLSRIEQGKTLMEIKQVPVQRIVETCLHEQQRAAEEKEIALISHPGEDGLMVHADEDGLRQIMINLIDNAIKYTPSGGRVTVGWKAFSDRIELYVEDTGLGIPKEMQDRVFERFFRVDKARSRELGGTGLGLAIVKHLTQSFGGSVEVTSKIGSGSRFAIRLPRS